MPHLRPLLIALLVMFGSSCDTIERGPRDVREMLESTVEVLVHVEGVVKTDDGDQALEGDVSGSGVVYEKTDGLAAPVTSKILTAQHVLGSYAAGQTILTLNGPLTLTRVTFSVRTHDGRVCGLSILKLGPDMGTHDVATGEADCDAGRIASIASRVPPEGSRIFVVGHPLGIERALVTEGRVSGWYGGFLLVSAPATHGNSGGPVFNARGEVVGLLVRGSDEYSSISLVVSLQSVLERIAGR